MRRIFNLPMVFFTESINIQSGQRNIRRVYREVCSLFPEVLCPDVSFLPAHRPPLHYPVMNVIMWRRGGMCLYTLERIGDRCDERVRGDVISACM